MSPVEDAVLDEIRGAIHRLKAAGAPCDDDDIAAELEMTPAEFHATMRQLFSGCTLVPGGVEVRDGRALLS